MSIPDQQKLARQQFLDEAKRLSGVRNLDEVAMKVQTTASHLYHIRRGDRHASPSLLKRLHTLCPHLEPDCLGRPGLKQESGLGKRISRMSAAVTGAIKERNALSEDVKTLFSELGPRDLFIMFLTDEEPVEWNFREQTAVSAACDAITRQGAYFLYFATPELKHQFEEQPQRVGTQKYDGTRRYFYERVTKSLKSSNRNEAATKGILLPPIYRRDLPYSGSGLKFCLFASSSIKGGFCATIGMPALGANQLEMYMHTALGREPAKTMAFYVESALEQSLKNQASEHANDLTNILYEMQRLQK